MDKNRQNSMAENGQEVKKTLSNLSTLGSGDFSELLSSMENIHRMTEKKEIAIPQLISYLRTTIKNPKLGATKQDQIKFFLLFIF